MALVTCVKCRVRAANRPGRICYECWKMDGGFKQAEESRTLLEDMRYVRALPESEDRSEGHKDCRAWKKRDPGGFLKTLMEMERDEKAGGGMGEGGSDEGSARGVEMCERLLRGELSASEVK